MCVCVLMCVCLEEVCETANTANVSELSGMEMYRGYSPLSPSTHTPWVLATPLISECYVRQLMLPPYSTT